MGTISSKCNAATCGYGCGAGDEQMAVRVHNPQNTKDDTFMLRIANEDNETGWITLHFQSLEDAREARTYLKKVIKVGAHNM
jgi:hypothetical protein